MKAGGDDYLTKPFALSELMARVEALLRRPTEIRATELHVGSVSLDLIERSVQRHGRPIELLGREFKLLLYFMQRPGQLITRGMLLEHIWNCHFLPQSNPIDVHIAELRRKLDGPGEPPLIQSVRGQGFVLVPERSILGRWRSAGLPRHRRRFPSSRSCCSLSFTGRPRFWRRVASSV